MLIQDSYILIRILLQIFKKAFQNSHFQLHKFLSFNQNGKPFHSCLLITYRV